jgi:hypothetical protein
MSCWWLSKGRSRNSLRDALAGIPCAMHLWKRQTERKKERSKERMKERKRESEEKAVLVKSTNSAERLIILIGLYYNKGIFPMI